MIKYKHIGGVAILTLLITLLFFTPSKAAFITAPSGADNLGDHSATQNIKLNTFWLSGDGGSEGVFVNAAGNVGIGTNNPTQKLHVNGSVQATSFLGNATTATSLAANGSNCSAGYYPLGVDASGAVESCTLVPTGGGTGTVTGTGITNYVSKWTSTSAQGNSIIFDNGTNVGIGTNNPSSTLVIYTNTGSGSLLKLIGSGPSVNASIHFMTDGGSLPKTGLFQLDYSGNMVFRTYQSGLYFDARSTAGIHFRTTDSNTERITIINNGNVGIGITAPTQKLDVVGYVKASSGFLGNATTATSLAANGTNCSAGYYPLGVDASGAAESCTLVPTGGGTGTVTGTGITNYIAKWTSSSSIGNSSVMAENGTNVGIGSLIPNYKLDVAGGDINIENNFAYLQGGYNTIKLATKGDTVSYSSIIIGKSAGDDITDGTTKKQIAIGHSAGSANSGANQIALGYQAGMMNEGANQTVIGSQAGWANTGVNQIALGYQAGTMNEGANQMVLGYQAGLGNAGAQVIGIGYGATSGNIGNDVVAIGYEAGKDNTVANQFIVKQNNINSTPLIQGDFSSGNVGIGTTNPYSLLHVNGTGSFGDSVTATSATRALNLIASNAVMRIWRKTDTAGNDTAMELITSAANSDTMDHWWDIYLKKATLGGVEGEGGSLVFRQRAYNGVTNAINMLTIAGNTGNVGIGTTTPTQKLHVNGSVLASAFLGNATTATALAANGANCSAGYYPLGVNASGAAESCTLVPTGGGTGTVTGTGTTNYVSKWTSTSAQGNSIIFDNGTNVGIGTTNPGSKLSISEKLRLFATTPTGADSTTKMGYLFNNNSPAGSFIETVGTEDILSYGINVPQVGVRNTAKVGGIFRLDTRATQQKFVVYGYPTGGSTEYERISVNLQDGLTYFVPNGGNVGIGTTNPGYKLHVNGTSYLNGQITTSLSGAGNRCAYVDAYGNLLAKSADCGTATGGDNLGNHSATQNIVLNSYWLSGDGGSEGVFVNAAGNVGIGTNNPTQKLHVNGSVQATSFLGNATTATSLAANGSNCSAGYYPLGVNASGAAESCTLVPTGTGGGITEDIYWTGTATNLVAATGRTSLGLGSLATLNAVSGGSGGTITDGTILDADISASTDITATKIQYGDYFISSAGTNGYVWTSDGTGAGVWAAAPSGGTDIYWTGTATNLVAATGRTSLGLGSLATLNAVSGGTEGTITDNSITTVDISNGTILDADISASTDITATKIQYGDYFISSAGTNGYVWTSDGTGAGIWSASAPKATALAANGSNCSAGYYATGVDASGAAEGCTLASTGGGSGTVTGTGTANYVSKWTGTSSQGNSSIFDNGTNVGIGSTNPQYKLEVVGTSGIGADAFIYRSDRNLKFNIKKIDNALEKIKALEGVTFKWRVDGSSSIGLIAQDVEKVFPELVTGKEGKRGVQYGNLVAPLIEAIKEQQQQIDNLQQRIVELEKRQK